MNYKGRSTYSVLVILFLFCTQAAYAKAAFSDAFGLNYAQRSQLFRLSLLPQLDKLPVQSQLSQLDAWEHEARQKGDEAVRLEVVLARYIILDNNSIITPQKRIKELTTLLKSLDKEKHPDYAVLIMTDIGNNYYGKLHNYAQAFDNYINAYYLAKTFSSKDFPDKKQVLVNVGNRYYSMGDLDRAKIILLEADSVPDYNVSVTSYNNKNTLGLIYRSKQRYDTAIQYFNTAHALALKSNDSVWSAIILGNIGISYYLQGNYAKALPLLKQDVTNCFKPGSNAVDNGMKSLLIMADIHLKQEQTALVKEDMDLAKTYMDSCRDRIKSLSTYHSTLARYYFKTGELKAAYYAQDSAAIFKDSLSIRDNIQKLAKVEHAKEIQRHEQEVRRLSAERLLLLFTGGSLLVGIVLLGIIGMLFFNRQKLKYIAEQNALSAKQELAEQQLNMASNELQAFTQHLQEKNVLIEKAGLEIEKLQSLILSSETEQQNNEVLQQLYSSTILTDEEWKSFRVLFEQVHKGYLQRLKDKIPDLTPADTRFIVLSKLNLSNKEMAGILGVQADTIRSYKHRLRKRFGLPEDEGIKAWIDAI